jgi:hypothetical protein
MSAEHVKILAYATLTTGVYTFIFTFKAFPCYERYVGGLITDDSLPHSQDPITGTCFVFGRSQVPILAWRLAILTGFHGFPQSLQANAGIVS